MTNPGSVQNYLRNTLTMILAGGRGERLYPLTRDRAKPSVPFGGIYRIIDFTLSNCLNSGLRKIYVLTQYKSISLERHISFAWNILTGELDEFVATIPPQQRSTETWYRGTADALFQNIYTLQEHRPERVLVLSGDHVYKMNYHDMLLYHMEKQAEITVACVEQDIERAAGQFGIVESDKEGRIVGFEEKPSEPKPTPHNPGKAYCNMGVYLFETETLIRCVVDDAKKRETTHDFGRDIIPREISRRKVFAFDFSGGGTGDSHYWRDIGTTDAYYEANMSLLDPVPPLDLYQQDWTIRTYQGQTPPARTVPGESGNEGVFVNSIISGGSVIAGGGVNHSILFSGVRVGDEAIVEDAILFNDVVIGDGAQVKNCIIDKGVSVPANETIGVDKERDRQRFQLSEKGIVVIPKNYRFG